MNDLGVIELALTQQKVANTIAMNIIAAEIKAEGYQKIGEVEQMNTEYAISAALKQLVSDLGIDQKYFASIMETLSVEECS